MTSSNIHTLADLNDDKKTVKKTFKKTKAVNAEKYLKSKTSGKPMSFILRHCLTLWLIRMT